MSGKNRQTEINKYVESLTWTSHFSVLVQLTLWEYSVIKCQIKTLYWPTVTAVLYMHRLHQRVCEWEDESAGGGKAGSALRDETLPTFKRYFKLFHLIKFSITWVNRGQWEKNKYLHLSQRPQPSPLPAKAHMHPHTDTRCQPIWLPVRKSHPPRQVPFSPRTIFPAMSDMGILMNAQWQYLGRRAAILPLQIYCWVTFVRQGKRK